MVESNPDPPEWHKSSSQVSGGGWSEYDEDPDENGEGVDDCGSAYIDDSAMEALMASDKGYRFVNQKQVSVQVVERITELEDLYNMCLEQLFLIARHYSWDKDTMNNKWFADSEVLKFTLGLEFDTRIPRLKPQVNASLPSQHGGYCTICYEQIDMTNSFSLSCQHTFCHPCWQDYLQTKVRSGYQGIDAACMQSGCNMRVGHDTFEKFLKPSPKDLETYWKWLCKSFTDNSKNVAWCPNYQCNLCCERTDETRMLYELKCECGTEFCFKCSKVSHMPCDCETAEQWNIKANAESENVTWIAANTKSCPGCHRNIEKNQGCNHMTCAQCRHEFCWICMGDWKMHGSATGGYY